MFRKQKKSELSTKNFSIGSLVLDGKCKFLLVESGGNSVRLLNLQTFELMNPVAEVEDANFLTQEEVRLAIRGLPGTFTDYDYDPKGLKS